MCVIKPTSLGTGVICAVCDPDCECVVCLPYDQQERNNPESTIIAVCNDCVYFNAYGRLDDQTMDANPKAGVEHADRIAAIWPTGTEFTSGCGRDCPDHGIAAHDGDEESYEDSQDNGPEGWFSWSPCEECDSPLGGTREHATAWVPVTQNA